MIDLYMYEGKEDIVDEKVDDKSSETLMTDFLDAIDDKENKTE